MLRKTFYFSFSCHFPLHRIAIKFNHRKVPQLLQDNRPPRLGLNAFNFTYILIKLNEKSFPLIFLVSRRISERKLMENQEAKVENFHPSSCECERLTLFIKSYINPACVFLPALHNVIFLSRSSFCYQRSSNMCVSIQRCSKIDVELKVSNHLYTIFRHSNNSVNYCGNRLIMVQIFIKNWSFICLVVLGGIVIANNVNSQEINANPKFQSAAAPTLSFHYW